MLQSMIICKFSDVSISARGSCHPCTMHFLFGEIHLLHVFGNDFLIQEHRNLAREAVRKTVVLLKNGKSETDPLIPLSKKVPKILVAGSHADNLGYQCGGWTINWQGFSGNNYTRGKYTCYILSLVL